MKYVSSHQELIDLFSMNTLNIAFEYLYDNPMTVKGWTADTKENAFNSGVNARINLGNNQFYDNVQSCYYVRRSLMKAMEESPLFRCTISNGDFDEFLQKLHQDDIDQNGNPSPYAMRQAMLKTSSFRAAIFLYLCRRFSRAIEMNQFTNNINFKKRKIVLRSWLLFWFASSR